MQIEASTGVAVRSSFSVQALLDALTRTAEAKLEGGENVLPKGESFVRDGGDEVGDPAGDGFFTPFSSRKQLVTARRTLLCKEGGLPGRKDAAARKLNLTPVEAPSVFCEALQSTPLR